MNDKLFISGLTLVRTCMACPEQYDVFLNDEQFGYLRLRHGSFRADYPDVHGDTAYQGYPKGEGIFEDEERMFFLKEACDSLIALHNQKILDKWNNFVD